MSATRLLRLQVPELEFTLTKPLCYVNMVQSTWISRLPATFASILNLFRTPRCNGPSISRAVEGCCRDVACGSMDARPPFKLTRHQGQLTFSLSVRPKPCTNKVPTLGTRQ
ncbi:hypothetical protein PHLGIDRAFT_307433 [Phlebiopsis gigantea 11061_1 CR5-6]|uniref:Uncharacterized protein n=1 Tax=Phlebiopsis gigantea (strain 11061_1 CR5-6) TaxID=745531 RepID=A0A0C3SB13_PHLG1|nr:hypothetical protein PHLGIDRAFT_307433 [Phlebiopsis gigantea 11061_1 CR5-6]